MLADRIAQLRQIVRRELAFDALQLLLQARLSFLELRRLLLQALQPRALNLAHLVWFRCLLTEQLPGGLPLLHRLLGAFQAVGKTDALFGVLRKLRRAGLQGQAQLFEFLCVVGQMPAGLFPGTVELLLFTPMLLARIVRMLDRLLETADLGTGGVEFALHLVEMIAGVGLPHAQFLDLGLAGTQLGDGRLQCGFVCRQFGFVRLRLDVQRLPAQGQQLGAHQTFLHLEFFVFLRGARLTLQAVELGLQLLTDVIHARQILACVLDTVFGFAPAFLITRYAGRLLEHAAQLFRLGFNDAVHRVLFKDRIGIGADAGTEEHIGDVLAPALGLVEKIIRLSVASGLTSDRYLGVARVLTGCATIGTIEDELDRCLAHGLARAGAAEDHVRHGIAAQVLGRAFAHHPTHRIDDIGFTAAIRADNADQTAINRDGNRIDKGLETGEFDFLEAH